MKTACVNGNNIRTQYQLVKFRLNSIQNPNALRLWHKGEKGRTNWASVSHKIKPNNI